MNINVYYFTQWHAHIAFLSCSQQSIHNISTPVCVCAYVCIIYMSSSRTCTPHKTTISQGMLLYICYVLIVMSLPCCTMSFILNT